MMLLYVLLLIPNILPQCIHMMIVIIHIPCIELKPLGKEKRGRPREVWMDVVDRYMKMVGLERKMADDRRR